MNTLQRIDAIGTDRRAKSGIFGTLWDNIPKSVVGGVEFHEYSVRCGRIFLNFRNIQKFRTAR